MGFRAVVTLNRLFLLPFLLRAKLGFGARIDTDRPNRLSRVSRGLTMLYHQEPPPECALCRHQELAQGDFKLCHRCKRVFVRLSASERSELIDRVIHMRPERADRHMDDVARRLQT